MRSCSVHPQDAESELSIHNAARTFQEGHCDNFISGGENKKSRSRSKRAPLYFMNKYVRSCRAVAAALNEGG